MLATEPTGHLCSHLCIPNRLKSVRSSNSGLSPKPPPTTRELIVKQVEHNTRHCHSALTQSFQQPYKVATIILIFIIGTWGTERQSKLQTIVQPAGGRAKIQALDSACRPKLYLPPVTVSPHLPHCHGRVSISWGRRSRSTMQLENKAVLY